MALEGDWDADGFVIARNLYDPARTAQLLRIAESCRHQWINVSNPEWGGVGGPRPVGSPPGAGLSAVFSRFLVIFHVLRSSSLTFGVGASATAEQLGNARSMRHLNHPGYFPGGSQSPDFKLLMEAIADPAVLEARLQSPLD